MTNLINRIKLAYQTWVYKHNPQKYYNEFSFDEWDNEYEDIFYCASCKAPHSTGEAFEDIETGACICERCHNMLQDDFFDVDFPDEIIPMWDELCGVHVIDSENPIEDFFDEIPF